MFKTNNDPFKKLAALAAALMFAVSMASCGKTDDADDDDKGEKKTTTTTTAAAESPAEETVTEEAESVPESETETETTAVTTKPDGEDLPIDAMMSSIEADIPEITAWSGLGDASSPDTVSQTTTTAAQSDATPETTSAASSADSSSLKNEQQFIFEGKTYDNSTFTSVGVSVPSGWTEARTEKQFENSAYPYSYILEGQSKGATFIIGEAKGSGQTSFPSLTLFKGLTWGATVAEIEAAYGAPAKEGHSEQYNTQLTNLFYSASDGSLIIYEVSADWGLIAVNCCGR